MKKITKFLSIMLLVSMTCGTTLSDVQFGQYFAFMDDVKAAGFIRAGDYLRKVGIKYGLGSHIDAPVAIGHAAMFGGAGRVMAVLTPDLTSYVTAGNVKNPGIQVFNFLDSSRWANIASTYPSLAYFIADNCYIHPTVTFPDIIKQFQK